MNSILATMFVVGTMVLMLALNGISFDADEDTAHKIYGVLVICLILGVLLLLIVMHDDARTTANNKHNLQEWRRFEKAVSADSSYTFYYNGQAVSGAAIGIDKNDIGDYEIEYDEKNKIIKIMQKR